ncbi:hypothetical protein GWK47_012230 [Chionoecetes opilio]|uniref:Endonuclease/exonuclease/phosphatase domain-containing protein n=1 Tax=Chionoecetes opilio TaxID=41210 RepID=A0A8J5CLZ5_CHIOP|nr:hypothetical protein GWK47_012230 [Chionoecetes opilio]
MIQQRAHYLGDLSGEELVAQVISLRRELASSKGQIKTYSEVIDELPEKRRVLVEALSVVDTLLALKNLASGNTENRTISCTARPDKIEKDWDDHIRANAAAREWWAPVIDSGGEDSGGEDEIEICGSLAYPPNTLPPLCPSTPSPPAPSSNYPLPHPPTTQGYSEERCPKRLTCEYCQGRFHTIQTCQERLVDKRHQDLIEAVRVGRQEKLAVLRGAATWRLPSHSHTVPGDRQQPCPRDPTPNISREEEEEEEEEEEDEEEEDGEEEEDEEEENEEAEDEEAEKKKKKKKRTKKKRKKKKRTTKKKKKRNLTAILLCVCYRPQWKGRQPIEYLHTHLNDLLQQHTCEHVVIIGDMNQHLVARSFDDFLTVYGLTNQVDFPTHISGSSLDPVISDLPDSVVTCSPLGAVGSSDHMAILSTIQVAAQRDAPITRTNWLWGRADWDGLCDALQQTPWSTILVNDVDTQVLQTVISWGRRWQVDLAPEKTQAILISRRQRPPDTPIPTILLGGRPVPLQRSISILGVEVNSVLTFTDHIRTIARKATWKLSCVRRVSHLLDSQGITTLYAAQVRSLMEHAPLTWSSCPPSYLSLLDKVQARAQRLITVNTSEGSAGPASPSSATLAAASRHNRSVCRLQDTQAACPAPGCSPTALGKTTRPHHTNCCYQGPSTDRPFCQDGDLSAFLLSALHTNVEPHGTADTTSLYLVTPDIQECCERLDKAAIV